HDGHEAEDRGDAPGESLERGGDLLGDSPDLLPEDGGELDLELAPLDEPGLREVRHEAAVEDPALEVRHPSEKSRDEVLDLSDHVRHEEHEDDYEHPDGDERED